MDDIEHSWSSTSCLYCHTKLFVQILTLGLIYFVFLRTLRFGVGDLGVGVHGCRKHGMIHLFSKRYIQKYYDPEFDIIMF